MSAGKTLRDVMRRHSGQTGAKGLQEVMVRHGFWLEEDDAVRLTEEVHAGLPAGDLIEQAMRLARPLNENERRKLTAAGILDDACPDCRPEFGACVHQDGSSTSDCALCNHRREHRKIKEAGRVAPLSPREP